VQHALGVPSVSMVLCKYGTIKSLPVHMCKYTQSHRLHIYRIMTLDYFICFPGQNVQHALNWLNFLGFWLG
jgi:hypothetical protein